MMMMMRRRRDRDREGEGAERQKGGDRWGGGGDLPNEGKA